MNDSYTPDLRHCELSVCVCVYAFMCVCVHAYLPACVCVGLCACMHMCGCVFKVTVFLATLAWVQSASTESKTALESLK